MPKIGLYPDSKLSCLSIIQSQENRLSHRPISSAIGTGGLDFLIANALLILCHSLFKVVIRVTHEKIFLFELHSHNNFMGGRRMRPPGSLISGIISLFELIKSNTLSVDHWHYNSKLFSFNKNSLTPIVTYPLSSRRGFIVLSTTIIFLNESFALSKDFVS